MSIPIPRRPLYATLAISIFSAVLMGERRPDCSTAPPNTYGRGVYLSPENKSIRFAYQATEDIQGGTGSLPTVFTSSQSVIYSGDEDSLLYYFPTSPAIQANPLQWIGLGYQVLGNHVAGNTQVDGGQPPVMSDTLSAAPTGATHPFFLRHYDRGNCSWFFHAADLGKAFASAIDNTGTAAVLNANAYLYSDFFLTSLGPWELALGIEASTATTSVPDGGALSPTITNDRFLARRKYDFGSASGTGSITAWVQVQGRLFVQSGEVRLFLTETRTVDEYGEDITEHPGVQDTETMLSFLSRVRNSIYTNLSPAFATYMDGQKSTRGLPDPLRTALMPTGLDMVLSQSAGDSGATAMSSHSNRSNYCGAQRDQPLTFSGTADSRSASGTVALHTGTL